MHYHFAYGLNIASELKLPGMPECAPCAPDVTIREGTVDPDAVPGNSFRNWRAEPGRLLVELFGEGRILVKRGEQITFERENTGKEIHLTSTIMGTGLAAILLQREVLPLHASCVKTEKGAVLVMGKSGAGKSTTLTGLLEAGCTMMVDDVTAVEMQPDGVFEAIPAFPAVRVWQDVLERSDIDYSTLDRVRPDMAKYYLPVEHFHAQPEPIAGIIYMLAGNGAEAKVDLVPSAERFPPLRRMVYRKAFLESFGLQAFAFQQATAMAREVPMVRFERPTTAIAPVEVARHALDALGI